MTQRPVNSHLDRWRRLAVICLAVSFLGAGCVGPAPANDLVDKFPREPLTIKIWRPFNENLAYQSSYEAYQRDHKNVSFDYKFIDPADYQTELIDALASGNGPDIVSLQNDEIAKFQGALVPMPDKFFEGTTQVNGLTSKYPPAVATDAIQDGKVYGLPFYMDTLALFVNTGLMSKIFQEYVDVNKQVNSDLFFRQPADWSTLVQTAKLVVKRKGAKLERPGIALGTSKNVPHMADITAALLLQQGASLVTPDKKGAAFHLPDAKDPTFYPGEAVLKFLKGFTDPASDYYSWNADQPDAVQDFVAGRLPMMLNYRSAVGYVKQRNPTLSFSTTPFPQIANAEKIVDFGGYSLEAVTNNSKYPQVAWDFLHTTTLYTLPDYHYKTGRTSAVRLGDATTTVFQRRDNSDPFTLQVPTAHSWFKGKDPVAADGVLTQMLDRVTTQGAQPRESLFQAGQALTRLLSSP